LNDPREVGSWHIPAGAPIFSNDRIGESCADSPVADRKSTRRRALAAKDRKINAFVAILAKPMTAPTIN
jgi:hypothetical protein